MSAETALPSSARFLEVIRQAEASEKPLNIKKSFLPILQSILPEKYGSISLTRNTIKESVVPQSECVVLCSGGLASTASLWRILSSGREPTLVHIQGMFEEKLSLARLECIKEIAIESRNSNGFPLLRNMTQKETCLKSLKAPKGSDKISRRARIALIITIVHEMYKGKNVTFVWGNAGDCSDVIEAMCSWGFNHIIPFCDSESAVFALSEAENISEKIRSSCNVVIGNISPSHVFPSFITNTVCSCWSFPTGKWKSRKDQKQVSCKPFLAMCGRCMGCDRYVSAWNSLCHEIPTIQNGKGDVADKDDHRHYLRLASFREEKKIKKCLSAYIEDRKTAKEKKGKKIRLEEEERDAEEKKEEEDMDEEEGDLEEGDADIDLDEEIVPEETMIDEEEKYSFEEAFEEEDDQKKKKRKKIV